MFHLIAYRPARYIFDMFPVLFYLLYSRVSKGPRKAALSIFMKVLNFGSNILAEKFPVSGLF